jgi:1-acyl-sn-glycerol-3-phosphate acyltransferase
MGYRITIFIAKLIVRLFTRLELRGTENVPASGSYVLASNHLGRLDPILIYYFSGRRDIIMLVAEKYGKYRLIRWFVKQLDGIFVNRFEADFGAVREALTRLRKGGVLVLAPEGTRSQTGALIDGKPGVIYMAAKAGVPIIPVAITGTEDKQVVASLKRLRRPKVVARAGQAFTLPPLKAGRSAGRDRDEALQEYTDEIMCQIGALLPPEYRGVYAEHARLKELLRTAGNSATG